LREIRDNPNLKLQPIGFLDDNPLKQGKTIHGVSVLGQMDQIDSFVTLFDSFYAKKVLFLPDRLMVILILNIYW
jgi:Predicted nucleoside-diphosphate sugar epimerases